MTTLGRELQRRGYRVTLIALADVEQKARDAGLGFAPLGESDFPRGHMAAYLAELGQLSSEAGLRFTIAHFVAVNVALLRDVPHLLRQVGADILLADQTQPGTTVAEVAGIPCVTVCCALAMNGEPDVPPFITPWPYDPTPAGRGRNLAGYRAFTQMIQPVQDVINAFRREHGLAEFPVDPPYTVKGDSDLAIISQQPSLFDFPRESLPSNFHYVGPLCDSASGDATEFSFERLDGRPLIYASMGTLQNRQDLIFRTIAEACRGLEAQLVISMGRKGQPILADLPGDPLVVPYAPQRELLRRATLTITHAGLNTVLESLSEGVPMVAIPITNDQPGVASRLAYIGAGEVVQLSELSADRLRSAVEPVLSEPRYREFARQAQKAIATTNGPRLAADIVESVLRMGRT